MKDYYKERERASTTLPDADQMEHCLRISMLDAGRLEFRSSLFRLASTNSIMELSSHTIEPVTWGITWKWNLGQSVH